MSNYLKTKLEGRLWRLGSNGESRMGLRGYIALLSKVRRQQVNTLNPFSLLENWQQINLRNPYLAADRRHHGVGGYLTVQVCKQDELQSAADFANQVWITGASLEVTNCYCLCWGWCWDGLWEQVLVANAIHKLIPFDLNHTLHCTLPLVSFLMPTLITIAGLQGL